RAVGQEDIFFVSYASDGKHRWSKSFGEFRDDVPRGVAANAAGLVALTGSVLDAVDLGGGPLATGGFLASYTSTGVHRWSRGFDTGGIYGGQGVVIDDSGNVTMVGGTGRAVDLGGGLLPVINSGPDIIVGSYTSAGVHRWSKSFNGPGREWGEGVGVDAQGNITITGCLDDPLDLGGGSLTSTETTDIFVASYDSTGGHRWSAAFGGSGMDVARAVAVGVGGDVSITGFFEDVMDFGDAELSSAGGRDLFVAQFNP
ncbi:MAG: hypothetical protein JRH20_29040, partial [Deltaproteobacteria bacterium]|nr:hypothetical protein [Deltaproteobacteria bacterium]